MYENTLRFVGLIAILTALLLISGLVSAQVQVSGSLQFTRSIEPHLNNGGERLNLLGIGIDPDDGVTFLACSTDSDLECPSSDNIHIYRHDVASNMWVFESSILHPNQVFSGIVDIDGDAMVVGRGFGTVQGNDGLDVYRRGPGGWTHEASLLPNDHFVYDMFGYAVSIHGDVLAATALLEGDDSIPSSNGPGAVYVFERTNGTWTETQKVTSNDAGSDDEFGNSIALRTTPSGWRLIVGAPEHSTDPGGINRAGAVYAFEHENNSTSQVGSVALSTAQDAIGDFGSNGIGFDGEIIAVTEDGDLHYYQFDGSQGLVSLGTYLSEPFLSEPVVVDRMILVGEPSGSINAPGAPSVTLIRENAMGVWMSTSFPAPSGFTVSDNYATSLDFNGSLIAAGVPTLDYAGPNSGGIWTQTTGANTFPTQLLLEGAGTPNSNLGESVAADGAWMAIGAPGAVDTCQIGSTGMVRMLHHSEGDWMRIRDITPPNSVTGDEFGRFVVIDANTMAVGMPGYTSDQTGDRIGAVFIYSLVNSNWSLAQTLEGSRNNVGFAETLALQGDDLFVGQPAHVGLGSVVQFRRDPSGVWGQVTEATITGITSGARFGHALSLHNGVLLVGAPHDQNNTGSVHAYTVSNGTLAFAQTLTVPGSQVGAHAGWSVSQNDDHALIGLPFRSPGQPSSVGGLVTIISKVGASFGSGVSIADPSGAGEGFGTSITTDGTLVAVSSHDPGSEAVRLLAYNGTDYQLIGSAPSPTGTASARYGAAIAIAYKTLTVGAPDEHSVAVPAGGKAHQFAFEIEYTVPECDMDMVEDLVQWIEDATPNASELFAYSAEMDGGFAIVGVPYEKFSFVYAGNTINADNAGKATIFERTGLRSWTPVADFRGNKIDTNPETGHHADWLGWSVDIENGTAAAGGIQAVDEANSPPTGIIRSGAVQVYERNSGGWSRTIELFPSNNGTPGADRILEFGAAVDIDSSGDKLIVGARNSYLGGVTGTGAAFVYEQSGDDWLESNVLSPPNVQVGDHNGDSVAVEEDWAAVGSPDDHNGLGGVVHLFRRVDLGVWTHHSTILSPTNESNSQFGQSMELSRSDLGLTLVVGAHYARDGFNSSVGAVFVFVYEPITQQWTQIQKLGPELVRTSILYGTDVSIDHNTIAVGGPQIQNSTQGTNWTGGVEMYNLDAGTGQFERRAVIRPDTNQWGTGNGWGRSIGLSGGTVLLGTEYADGEPFVFANGNRNWGAMIAYDIVCVPEPTCLADVNGDGMLSPADFSAWIAAFNTSAPQCDQNGDGACTPADFSAWIQNYNAGCQIAVYDAYRVWYNHFSPHTAHGRRVQNLSRV